METQSNNGMKEAAVILEHVQQALGEHQKMQKAVELYLEKNGVKPEYEIFWAKKLESVKNKNVEKSGRTMEKTSHKLKKQKATGAVR